MTPTKPVCTPPIHAPLRFFSDKPSGQQANDINAKLADSPAIIEQLKQYVFPQIEDILRKHKVVLFMKGTPDSPECGFSKFACILLKHHGIDFVGVDVLDDPAIRQGIKLYGGWPTIPQLYVDGELIGGSDVLQQLHETGQLHQVCRGTSK